MNPETLPRRIANMDEHTELHVLRNQMAESFMKTSWRVFLMLCVLSAGALAQSQPSGAADGKDLGGFQVEQSAEFGYRFTDVTGSEPMYNTLLNFQQGPRLLEQTLSLRSPQHTGALFDNLLVSSFGWGGDPENVGRVNMSKSKAYDFTFLFRRDQNYFDYDLLANPLNPSTVTPYRPVNQSPHSYYTRRRMYDYGLTILPDSKITFRLGYSRNRSEGPSYSSFHEGTDVLLNQDWNITENLYRIGMDFKGVPRTTLSYDQFLSYDKNDTDYTLGSFASGTLSNGATVEWGLPWNPPAGAPCATPILTSGLANPSCNGYYVYNRDQRVRSSTPTEQLRLASNYFRRVNITAGATYSSSSLDSPYSEFFDGLVTRTRERQFTFSGPVNVRRINTTADAGVTVELTKSIHLNDSFRYDNWHIPGQWLSTETATVGAGATVTLLSPLGATTSSTDLIANYLGQMSIYNVFTVQYAPSRMFGVNFGYKLRHRHVFKAEPETSDPEGPFEGFEGDDITVNEHGPVFSFWLMPTPTLRVNVEAEAMTADNFLTRISPRQRQNYRARANYRPVRWANVSGTLNIWNSINGESDTQFAGHYRNYGFATTLMPRDRFSLDLAYNYTDAQQNAYICYNSTFIVPGTVVNGCPTYSPTNTSLNPNPNWIYSIYSDTTHYFSATVMVKPIRRLTANMGYGMTRTNGDGTLLSPLQPTGTLAYNYYQPLASLNFELVKDWSLNAYWNYDQYREAGLAGPTLPRNFHDNRAVVSVKYAF
jgi:hypothetical protein